MVEEDDKDSPVTKAKDDQIDQDVGAELLQNPRSRDFRIIKYRNPHTRRDLRLLLCDHENCNKIFRKFHNFYDHLRIHTGEHPFACPLEDPMYPGGKCTSRFTQKSNLNKHITKHKQQI
jgi:uncharacterized Zn-finger protein